MLPRGKDVLAFQCRNPIHKAHYELFIRALEAPNVGEGAVCLVHPTCGPTQVRCTCYDMCINFAGKACCLQALNVPSRHAPSPRYTQRPSCSNQRIKTLCLQHSPMSAT